MPKFFLIGQILLLTTTASALGLGSRQDPLPDPDGKPADMSKPVQVYISLGDKAPPPLIFILVYL